MERQTINIRVTSEQLPPGINGLTTRAGDGTDLIIVNSSDPEPRQTAAYLHELLHIWHGDIDTEQSIDALERARDAELAQVLQLLRIERG